MSARLPKFFERLLGATTDRANRDALIGDLADGGAFIALGDEDALGRLEDLGQPQVAVALGLARRSAGRGGAGH